MMRPLLAAIIVMFVCAGAAGERVIIEGVEYELANGSAEIYHVNETQLRKTWCCRKQSSSMA